MHTWEKKVRWEYNQNTWGKLLFILNAYNNIPLLRTRSQAFSEHHFLFRRRSKDAFSILSHRCSWTHNLATFKRQAANMLLWRGLILKCTQAHACWHTYTCTHKPTHPHTNTQAHTYTHTRMYTHARAHAHTQTLLAAFQILQILCFINTTQVTHVVY